MTDERLRAELRKAQETGEWMPYLVEAQRAGVSLEEALLETQGAAIPPIQTYSDELHRISDEVEAKITQWMTLAEGIPHCWYNDINAQPYFLTWTYAVLSRRDKSREHYKWCNGTADALRKYFERRGDVSFDRWSEPLYNEIFHGSLRPESLHQRRRITNDLKLGNIARAEEFTLLLSDEDRFVAYLDLSLTLKNKEYQND